MVEKRFALAYETNDQYCIWWAVRDGDITLWKEEVVDCLNNLYEENIQLKKELQFRNCVGKSVQILTRSDWEDLDD